MIGYVSLDHRRLHYYIIDCHYIIGFIRHGSRFWSACDGFRNSATTV